MQAKEQNEEKVAQMSPNLVSALTDTLALREHCDALPINRQDTIGDFISQPNGDLNSEASFVGICEPNQRSPGAKNLTAHCGVSIACIYLCYRLLGVTKLAMRQLSVLRECTSGFSLKS